MTIVTVHSTHTCLHSFTLHSLPQLTNRSAGRNNSTPPKLRFSSAHALVGVFSSGCVVESLVRPLLLRVLRDSTFGTIIYPRGTRVFIDFVLKCSECTFFLSVFLEICAMFSFLRQQVVLRAVLKNDELTISYGPCRCVQSLKARDAL